MTEKANLIKCSRCKSTMSPEYFSKKKKGDYFKCCDNCKHNKKDKQITLTDKRDEEGINKARTEWIHSMIDNSNGQMVYLGPFDPTEVPDYDHSKLPDLSGHEMLVEYHAFELGESKIPILCRWRIKQDTDITQPLHTNNVNLGILR